MKKILSKMLGGALLFSLSMSLTSCEDVLGHWEKPVPTPTVEEVIKYGFKVTDLTGVDRTEAVTSLKMTNDDGLLVATAEVSAGKITITNKDLTTAAVTAAADFWFEATIGSQPYVAKVNIDPATLSPETDKTLEMATLGNLAGQDGKFYATKEDIATAGTTAVGVIAYIGSDAYSESIMDNGGHGLVLCLKDAAKGVKWGPMSRWEFGEGAKVSNTDELLRSTDVSGYNNTKTLAEKDGASTNYPACYKAFHYGEGDGELKAPTGSSGWFVPSAQQWAKIQQSLGGLDGSTDNLTVKMETSGGYPVNYDTDCTCPQKLDDAIKQAGDGNYDSMISATGRLAYWSSSEITDAKVIVMYFRYQDDGPSKKGLYWSDSTKNSGEPSNTPPSPGTYVRTICAF